MATLLRRLELLEQQSGDDGGQAVCGVMRVHAATGTGPDVVTVQPTGERMTEAAFRARYPRGILVVRQIWGEPDADDSRPA